MGCLFLYICLEPKLGYMICKYYLMIGSDSVDRNSESCIEVSAMISNLKDLKLSYSRVDYGGVTRKSGSTIEFIGDARDRIIDYFMSNGVNSLASFAVYAIEDDWTYKEIFSCPLDFSSFSYDSYVAKLSCLDNSIAAKIKANNNTKYEFNVSELKAPKQLAYDRVSMRNEASIQAIGNKQTGNDTYTELKPDVWWYYPRIGIIDTNLVNNESILLQDSPETFQTDGTPLIWGMPGLNKTDVYFLECLKDCTVSIDFSNIGIGSYGCVLAKISGSSSTPLNCGYSNVMSKDENTIGNFKWSGALLKGEKLQFAIYNYTHGRPGYSTNIFFEANKKGYILWDERQSPYYFDAIKPDVLLDKIISSMCPGMDVRTYIKESITNANGVEIDNPSIKNVVLCPAECVRQISDAKIYTSFSDFCQWMEDTFGYVYQIVEMAENEDEFLLPNIYDFKGFVVYNQNLLGRDEDEPVKRIVAWRMTKDDSMEFAAEFDYLLGEGIPGTEPSLHTGYTDEFPERGNYQIDEYGGDPIGTRIYTDRYYRDTENYILYYAVNKTKPTFTSGAKYYWYNELYELELKDINKNKYNDTLEFGFIDGEVEAENVIGFWFYEVLVENICYCRKAKRFAYHYNGSYYIIFDGYEKYLNGNDTRDDVIYHEISTQENYILVKECMTRCTLLNEDTEVVKYPTVYFRHRDEVFQNLPILKIESVSDFTYKLATDRLYSRLNIGYEKQDYDLGNNGKDEFNFKSVYTTGITLDDKELNMISPYRADSYGMEELTSKINQDTSSSDSDKQTFAVCCIESDKEFVILRDSRISGVSSSTVFNASLSVLSMIKENKKFLASFSKKLSFVSTEGNSNVTIDDVKLSDDIELSEPLFGVGNISFSTNNFIIPEEWNGYIEITCDGKVFRGFVLNLEISIENKEVFEYELIEC